jgi:hypothetical protein
VASLPLSLIDNTLIPANRVQGLRYLKETIPAVMGEVVLGRWGTTYRGCRLEMKNPKPLAQTISDEVRIFKSNNEAVKNSARFPENRKTIQNSDAVL